MKASPLVGRSGASRALAYSRRHFLPVTPPAGLIVSTGRSGSRYLAAVLAASGIAAGHEQYWSIERAVRHERTIRRLDVDVSWLAVPFLERHRGWIVHQVREPQKVIGSLVGMRFFSAHEHREYRSLVVDRMPLTGDDLEDAANFWVRWNRTIEQHAAERLRTEDVGVDEVARLVERAGRPADRAMIERVLKSTPSDVNRLTPAAVSWSDIRRTQCGDDVARLAEEYGYDAD